MTETRDGAGAPQAPAPLGDQGPDARGVTGRLARATRGSGPASRLWALARVEKRLMWRVALLQVMQSLTFLPFTAALKYLLDDIIPWCQTHHVVWPIVLYALANLVWWPVHGLFTVLAFSVNQHLVRSLVARLRRLVVDQLQRMSLNFFASRGAGALSNQVTVDMGRIESLLTTVATQVLVALVLAVATGVWLLFLNPLLFLVALTVIPPQIILMRAMRKRIDLLSQRTQKSGEGFSSKMVEFIAGMRLTKSFGNEAMVAGRLNDSIEEMRKAGLEASVTMRWVQMGMQMSSQYMPVLVWCVGGALYLHDPVHTTMGQLVAFTGMLGFLQGGIGAVTAVYDGWMQAKPGLHALFGILDSDELEGYAHPQKDMKVQGEVTFEDVTFRYPAASGEPVLSGITVHIPPGQRVGLVGETGAGKSTFLDLVLGFYAPSAGSIRYDGHPLSEIGLRHLRRAIAIMGQDAFLWNASVRENIRFGRAGATDLEIKEAAEKAQAADFIARLDQGYDTLCGERGSKLSGGQRQRVALARVFLRNPAIVILDEPTSALDLETEARLQKDLDVLCRGRTTFIVAHRLSTLRGVDRVLVFSQGRIVEDGEPEVLAARPDGHFARLWALQNQRSGEGT